MTKLSTHIPLKYIKQSKKLQEVECKESHYFNAGEWTGAYVETDMYKDDAEFIENKLVSAPTIADIIDNSTELLGGNRLDSSPPKYWTIMAMCKDNKSIEEISEYIIKNTKN